MTLSVLKKKFYIEMDGDLSLLGVYFMYHY